MKKFFKYALVALAAAAVLACGEDNPTPEPEPQDTYTGPVEGSSEWSVIGKLLEDEWTKDLVAAKDGDIYVVKNVKLAAADEFKFRKNKAWDENRGGAFEKLGEGFLVEQGGDNIKPGKEGIFDIYYNAAKEQVAVCEKDKAPEWPDFYVSPVKIDGNFDDWAKLDPTKVIVVDCAPEAQFKAIKQMKIYMDEVFFNVYLKLDMELLPDLSVVHCHTYFNADNDETTGGCNNQWVPGCIEYMTEGDIIRESKFISYDPCFDIWTGEPQAGGWEWEHILTSGSGVYTGAGAVDEYEMCLMRDAFKEELAEEFQFGVDVQQGWSSVGIIPNADLNEDNPTGKGSLVTVKVL